MMGKIWDRGDTNCKNMMPLQCKDTFKRYNYNVIAGKLQVLHLNAPCSIPHPKIAFHMKAFDIGGCFCLGTIESLFRFSCANGAVKGVKNDEWTPS